MSKQESSLWKKICKDPILSFLIGLFALLSALVLAVMFLGPVAEYVSCFLGVKEPGGVSKKYETLKSLVIVMGGVILVIQAWIANRRARAMENSAEAQVKAANAQASAAQAQADATKEQAKANLNTERGQRQERLKNAIEHLGHDKDSVRLGGAYELFHLAEEDTAKDKKTVLDILCAHIRRTTSEKEYREKYKSKPSEEIQSLLTLLFVQDHEVFKGLRSNLRGSYLAGADLPKARLTNTDLTRASLQGIFLREAYLREAVLWGSYLQCAVLQGACLQGANLGRTHLQGVNLRSGLKNSLEG